MQETNKIIITKIPKKPVVLIDEETGLKRKKRVCAYARVSTDLLDQKNSYDAQLSEYSTRIKSNPEWEFVDLYSDEGITGTCLKKREGFQRMIRDAKNGEIDLILVKSISRFARNTVDCLKTIRELKEKNVEVFFDKENISTLNKDIDIMLTIYASFAQEESKSISENVKWGVRKRMEKGQRKMSVATTIGYEKTEGGDIVINESEAKLIRRIFNLYLEGYSYRDIVAKLNKENVPTKSDKNDWDIAKIMRILANEKYVGQFVMQKTVVTNFLDHKSYKNDGLIDKYVVHNHHEPIISQEVFDAVQLLRESNNKFNSGLVFEPDNKYAGVLYCACCGRPLALKSVNYYSVNRRKILTCKVVNKSHPGYVDCDCDKPLDFNLALDALNDVIDRFYKVDENYVNLFIETYQAAINETVNELKTKALESTKTQERINMLITLASEDKDINKYKKEYEKEKAKLNEINKDIDSIKNDLKAHNYDATHIGKIKDFIKERKVNNYVVRKAIKLAIRKRDNSLVFVLGDSNIEPTKENITKCLSLPVIYSSTLENEKGTTLKYDVVRMEDSYGI